MTYRLNTRAVDFLNLREQIKHPAHTVGPGGNGAPAFFIPRLLVELMQSIFKAVVEVVIEV